MYIGCHYISSVIKLLWKESAIHIRAFIVHMLKTAAILSF